jgi:hypothetical protein
MTINHKKRLYTFNSILAITLCLVAAIKVSGQIKLKKFICEPTPAWVKPYSAPDIKGNYDLNLVLLHRELQYNHFTKEVYTRYIYYLRTIEGLNEIRSFSTTYEPVYENFKLNRVYLHRRNKVIALDKQLHVEYKIEGKQIGGVRYDDDAQVRIFFDQAQVGDLIEIAFTTQGAPSDQYDKLNFQFNPDNADLRGSSFFRILTKPNNKLFYKTINCNVEPARVTSNQLTSTEFFFNKDEETRSPKVPSWYITDRRVYCYEFDSWKDYIQLNLKNFRLDEPISPLIREKTEQLTKTRNTLSEKINSIFDYLQADIHYLSYGLIAPKRPETVVQQGFGDCKSKSLLAIKMLECLRVEAWPVLVKSDGLDERLLDVYSGQMLDHCVIEFVFNGDTLLFDPTRELQKGNLDQKFVSDFRYGLRLKKDSQGMSKLKSNVDGKISVSALIVTDIEERYNGRISWQIQFEGDIANQNNHRFKNEGAKSVLENLSHSHNYYNFLNVLPENCDISYTFNESFPISKLDVIPNVKSRVFEVIQTNQLGPTFALPDFMKTEQIFKIAAYEGVEFISDSTKFVNDWIQYHKKTWQQNDTIFASYIAEILKSDLDSSRYQDVLQDINFLKNDMAISLMIPAFAQTENSYTTLHRHYILISVSFLIISALSFGAWKLVRLRKLSKPS